MTKSAQWQGTGLAALLTVCAPLRYDEFLFTRFDVLHKLPVGRWNLRPGHFNAPFRHPNGGLCDVFFVFNASFFAAFVREVRLVAMRDSDSFHYANLSTLAPHHLMISRKRYYSDTSFSDLIAVNRNPLYELVRTRRWGAKEVNVRQHVREERGTLWWWWRIVRLLNSKGSWLIWAYALVLVACAGIWGPRVSAHGVRSTCPPAVLIANCVWLILPAWYLISNFQSAFFCSEFQWCVAHGKLP